MENNTDLIEIKGFLAQQKFDELFPHPSHVMEPTPSAAAHPLGGQAGASGDEQGLSTLHISSNPVIRIYQGGSLIEIEGKHFNMQKRELTTRRGRIGDFSIKSRWRLMRQVAKIDFKVAGLPDFITLTYPGEWSKDWRVWKGHLDVFFHALGREWLRSWGLWRLEFQPKREDHAPHFHVLVWEGPGVEGVMSKGKVKINRRSVRNKQIFNWLSETWFRIVGSGDSRHLVAGTRIEPIMSREGTIYYVSKYMAKLPDGSYSPVDFTGRFWGMFGRERWKVSLKEEELSERVFFKIKRVLRKRLDRIKKAAGLKTRKKSYVTDKVDLVAKTEAYELTRHENIHTAGAVKVRRNDYGDNNALRTFMQSQDAERLLEWAVLDVNEPGAQG